MTINDLSGWWLTYPSDKYDFVSWDYEIPNIWKNKSHVPKHQPDFMLSNDYLVGGVAILKSDGVRQWEGLSDILWKIKFMFETTNQYVYIYLNNEINLGI